MENSHCFFENTDCKYYPCHKGIDHINCMFCYCPMYFLDKCLGEPIFVEKNGRTIKVCTGCTFPHRPENYELVTAYLKEKIKK